MTLLSQAADTVTGGLLAWLLLLLVNLLAFFLMGLDKARARRRRQRRLSERVFFGLALAGGTPGILAGMIIFRHKTRHHSFTLGMPMVLLLQIICVIVLW